MAYRYVHRLLVSSVNYSFVPLSLSLSLSAVRWASFSLQCPSLLVIPYPVYIITFFTFTS